ncbi:MAG: hypothetical protein MH204_00840 [Fimbriimonadaceae bacterium]|nr:hypothetical protein [Fimbriimonadaceae bacterium]
MSDWQSWDDGSAAKDDMIRMNREISENPQARGEAEGLRTFRRTVRRVGLGEAVPEERLERMLRGVTAADRPRFSRNSLLLAAACTLVLGALAWRVIVQDPQATAGRSNVERMDADELAVAVAHSGVPARPLQLAGIGTFAGMAHGQGWIRMTIQADCGPMTLTIKRRPGAAVAGTPVQEGGREFLEDGPAILWGCGSCLYRLEASSVDTCLKTARRLSDQTGHVPLTQA